MDQRDRKRTLNPFEQHSSKETISEILTSNSLKTLIRCLLLKDTSN